MKEAIVYDMYQYLGVDASLYNYAKICVNGDYWGVYLALEAVEDSFMLRNYGTEDGNLYKPESMGVGGGEDEKDGEGGPGGEAPEMGEFPGEEMPQMGGDPQGGEMPRIGKWKYAQRISSHRRMGRCQRMQTFRTTKWVPWAAAEVQI